MNDDSVPDVLQIREKHHATVRLRQKIFASIRIDIGLPGRSAPRLPPTEIPFDESAADIEDVLADIWRDTPQSEWDRPRLAGL